jgi:hypothetical protein
MLNEDELPYGGDVSHAGDRYRVVDASNPWDYQLGSSLWKSAVVNSGITHLP